MMATKYRIFFPFWRTFFSLLWSKTLSWINGRGMEDRRNVTTIRCSSAPVSYVVSSFVCNYLMWNCGTTSLKHCVNFNRILVDLRHFYLCLRIRFATYFFPIEFPIHSDILFACFISDGFLNSFDCKYWTSLSEKSRVCVKNKKEKHCHAPIGRCPRTSSPSNASTICRRKIVSIKLQHNDGPKSCFGWLPNIDYVDWIRPLHCTKNPIKSGTKDQGPEPLAYTTHTLFLSWLDPNWYP